MATAVDSRPQMTIAELADRLEGSDDQIFEQLGKNLRAARDAQKENQREAGESGGGHNPSTYASIKTGQIVDLITKDISVEEFDENRLSDKQREFFEKVRKTFPYTAPRSMDEEGNITFHGRGQLFQMDPDGEIEGPIGDAGDCPECAEQIMKQIDEGHLTAQCRNCGKSLAVPPSDD